MENFGNITDDEDFLEFVNLVEHHREPQVYRNREDRFIKWNDNEFRDRFRLSKEATVFVIEEIHDVISPQAQRHHALTAAEMVLLTLSSEIFCGRFNATNSWQLSWH
ncbi:unnamed protein product [Callosobruchus maculatus]|uniref:Uncharacterized protein n=1 Tax=Callosobruchus maculatus TaxID=64391 RepID=A0A653CV37_CALMS|nr:unnamed protein product [Callosobruchus maculatus]